MSTFEKLKKELLSKPQSMRYEDISKLLNYFGYIAKETKGGSSHITFRKNGRKPITIPRHGDIKRTYIEIVIEAIKEDIK